MQITTAYFHVLHIKEAAVSSKGFSFHCDLQWAHNVVSDHCCGLHRPKLGPLSLFVLFRQFPFVFHGAYVLIHCYVCDRMLARYSLSSKAGVRWPFCYTNLQETGPSRFDLRSSLCPLLKWKILILPDPTGMALYTDWPPI